MKKILTVLAVVMGLIMAGNSVQAQGKIGVISLAELIPNMPEYKKADTSMNEFNSALQQQYDDLVKEYNEQSGLLSSKDTAKYTSAQLELKRKGVGDLLVKLQGWNAGFAGLLGVAAIGTVLFLFAWPAKAHGYANE